MHRPFSRFWGKPREPDRGKGVKETTHDRTKNTNTYAFLIIIVKGNDYKESREVEALALYNESCTCNYISARFAREQLQILNDPGNEMEGDCTLVWVCSGLGRYKQRSVFWIAPNADFDLLFGEEDEFNIRSSEERQFNWGIESGILSEEFPDRKPMKSFQGGINDEFLLPLERVCTSDSSRRTQMPSLADIKVQLAAELDCTSERRLEHNRRRALNIYNPHFVASSDDLRLRDDGDEVKLTLAVPEFSEPPRIDEFSYTEPQNSIYLGIGSRFKSNKRSLPDEHTSLSTDLAECCPRSPKFRNIRARPMSTHLSLDEHIENILGGASWTSDVLHNAKTSSTIEESQTEPCQDLRAKPESTNQPISSVFGREDGILFAGMARECSLDDTVLKLDSSISLPLVELCSVGESDGVAPRSESCQAVSTMVKKSGRKAKRKRKSKRTVSKLLETGDLIDKKFNEFWTRDEEAGNWFHFDESTKKNIWYEPPPLE